MKSHNISWDEYFMGVARISALRSKDPNTKVGACISTLENKIVGTGYNGFVNIPDNDILFPWKRDGDFENTKYAYVVHAEQNAILNATQSLKDCSLYVTLFPCNECSKMIVQSGIKKVYYLDDKNINTESGIVSKRILSLSNIIVKKLPISISITP